MRTPFVASLFRFGSIPVMIAASQSADNGSIPAQASRGGALQHPENINYMPGIPRGVSGWILVNYDLDYIGCVRDYYHYTGDLEAVKLLWPTIQKLIPYLMSRGALELETLKHFITDGRYGESWWGSHCVLEMQFVIGMQDALYLATIMEDEAMIRQCEEYLPRRRKHIVDTYFDKEAAGSRCHGWSAGPAYFLPGRILGVQVVEPGFAAVRIEPQLCDLEWAEGTIPTPRGLIKVRWEQDDSLTGTVTMPEGMTGRLSCPIVRLS